VPPGATAELNDHVAPTDSFSQLTFGGTGPEDQYFRHPTQRLALHTSGGSLVTLFPLDPTASIPQLVLSGTSGDEFRMGSTSGIRSGTSLTLGAGTLDLNGLSPTINGLSGTGIVTNSADTNSVLTIGAQGAGGDFAGTIADGWPAGLVPPVTRQISLVKTGGGSQRLTGAHTFSGATEIAAGTLVLDGSLHEHNQVTVRSGATLSGVGAVDGPLAVEAGGRIEPGSPGNLPGSHRGWSETWNAGSHFAVQLGGATPGSGHDQRRIAGSLSLAGAVLDVSSSAVLYRRSGRRRH
jgi:autotransporter-associated beta strand protein